MKRYDDQRLSDIVSAITAIRAHLTRGELSGTVTDDLEPLRAAAHRLKARVPPNT